MSPTALSCGEVPHGTDAQVERVERSHLTETNAKKDITGSDLRSVAPTLAAKGCKPPEVGSFVLGHFFSRARAWARGVHRHGQGPHQEPEKFCRLGELGGRALFCLCKLAQNWHGGAVIGLFLEDLLHSDDELGSPAAAALQLAALRRQLLDDEGYETN